VSFEAIDVDTLIRWMNKHTERCRICAYAQLREGALCSKAKRHATLLWDVAGAYRKQRITRSA
jgi:hypothetical protein